MKVTLDVPLVVGTPVTTPVVELSARPAGNAPPVTEYETPVPRLVALNTVDKFSADPSTMFTLIAPGSITPVEVDAPVPPRFTARTSKT